MSDPHDCGVTLVVEEGVARIRIDRPALRNALDRPAWAALLAAVEGARASTARVVTLEGAGGSFCAGGDLSTIEARLALPFEERRRALIEDARAIRALVELDRPTVALVDGPAMGAGLSLALACDVRLASRRSRWSAAFRKVGLAGDFGISWLLPRAIGRGRALDLLYSGDVLDAVAAQAVGLIERVIDDERYAEETTRYVAALAAGPASLPMIRGAVDRAALASFADAIEHEAEAQAHASRTEDAREGARAFFEKRPPTWKGR